MTEYDNEKRKSYSLIRIRGFDTHNKVLQTQKRKMLLPLCLLYKDHYFLIEFIQNILLFKK